MQRSSSLVRSLAVVAAVAATCTLAGCGAPSSPGPVVVASSPAGTSDTGVDGSAGPSAGATPTPTPGAAGSQHDGADTSAGASTGGSGGDGGTGDGGTGSGASGGHRGSGGHGGSGSTGSGGTASGSSDAVFPAGQPPRPGRQDRYPHADEVPGLPAAIRDAGHPGLQICAGDLFSLVTASGDLRGDGGRQYLVDTTCAMATGSSPDEVALYDVRGGRIVRSAVVSEFTANRPKPSAYPYLWQRHTVVLAYEGDRYRLVQLGPDSVTPGLVQTFR